MSDNHKKILISALLSICVLLVYGQVGEFEFMRYDDDLYVAKNTYLSYGIGLQGIIWAFTSFVAGNWHPMTMLSFLLDWKWFGMNAGGYHLINLVIHLMSGIFLFFVFERMTGHLWRSALLAAFFLIHPVHVESVASIAGRKDVLSGLFWMLTLWAYLRYISKPEKRRYFIVVLSFLLGVMSKATFVTLPFVLLLLDYWPLGRMSFDSKGYLPNAGELTEKLLLDPIAFQRNIKKTSLGKLILEKVPLMLISALTLILSFKAQAAAGAISSLDDLSLGPRLANGLISYVRYIAKAFYPIDLSFFYPHPHTWPNGHILLAGILLIAICIWVWHERRARPYLVVGWFWFVGVLVPMIGILQVGSQAMADRYMYLPLIGLSIMVIWRCEELLHGRLYLRKLFAVTSSLILIFLMLLSYRQTQYWRDSNALFTHAIEVTEGNYLAHGNWGAVLMEQKKYDEAVMHFEEALRNKPNYVQAKNNLGEIRMIQGKVTEAETIFREITRIQPRYVRARRNLCDLLQRTGRTKESLSCYKEALNLTPDDPELLNNLAVALASIERKGEAISLLRRALCLRPEYTTAKENLNALAGSFGAPEMRSNTQ